VREELKGALLKEALSGAPSLGAHFLAARVFFFVSALV